jgi:hypothetical protein
MSDFKTIISGMKVPSNTFLLWACYSNNIMSVFYIQELILRQISPVLKNGNTSKNMKLKDVSDKK